MATHNVKEENISFSDHDYVPQNEQLDEINLDNVFIDVENVESNENVTSRFFKFVKILFGIVWSFKKDFLIFLLESRRNQGTQ